MSLARRGDHLERELSRSDGVVVTIAADFLHGGEPAFARMFDRKGALLGAIHGPQGEPWAAFRGPGQGGKASKAADVRSLFIGGLPDAVDGDDDDRVRVDIEEPPRGAIVLPEAALHPSQVEALALIRKHRGVALVAGRRWGKSTILITLAVDAALAGKRVGIFASTRTLMSPLLGEIARALQSVPGASVNRVLGEIRLPNGGHLTFGRSITPSGQDVAGNIIWC